MFKPEVKKLYHYQSIELSASSPSLFEERGIQIADGIYIDKYKLTPLLERKAYYCSLSNYNDPFEGDFVLDSSPNAADVFLKLTQQLNKQSFSNEDFRNTFASQYREIADAIITNLRNTVGFYCLTPNSEHMTMWAHYGDNHQGIALEFERAPESPCGSLAFEVDYFDSPPKVTLSELLGDLINYQELNSNEEKGKILFNSSLRNLMFSKTNIWKSENEWRTSNAVGINNMPGKLTSIIFGLNTKHEVIKYLKNCTELKGVEFKYVIKCNETYGLKVVDNVERQKNYWRQLK